MNLTGYTCVKKIKNNVGRGGSRKNKKLSVLQFFYAFVKALCVGQFNSLTYLREIFAAGEIHPKYPKSGCTASFGRRQI